MITKRILLALAVLAPAAVAFALPEIDGTKDVGYLPLSVQNTETEFGDSNLGLPDFANGSEADNLYYVRTATTLYIFVGGNLESNFNKLEIFLDTAAGGDNRLLGSYPDVDFGALNRMSDEGIGNGLIFDAGFAPDYWYGMTCGGSPLGVYVNFSEVKQGGVGYYLGTTVQQLGSLSGGTNPNGVEATIDNSNIGGVPGGTGVDAGNGAGVMTGAEFAIPLAELANPTGPIKICVMVNGSGHDYLSNQILPGIGGGSNLAEPRAVDLNLVAGSQCVSIPGLPVVLAPTGFTVGLGSVISGNNASLAADDANPLKLCKAFVPNFASPRMRFDADFLSPYLSPSAVQLDLKARMTTGGSFKVRAFVADRTGGGFVYGAANQVVPDTTINLTFALYTGNSTNVANNVHTDGTMRSRVEIQQTGFSAVFVPCSEFEYLNLTVSP